MRFGFMPGKATRDAKYVVGQMQKFSTEGKTLYIGLVDMENAFDKSAHTRR